MILIKHRDHEEYHQQGEPFRLKKNVYFLSTKPNEKAGRWYYEMTHYSGNNGCAFGFYINYESYVNYYSQLDLDYHVIYLNGNSKTSQQNEDQRIGLPFKLTDPYTIGVGIDIKTSIFSVYYNNYTYSIQYNKSLQVKTMNAHIWGCNSDLADENISVNFGDLDFHYKVPGLLAWNQKLLFPTCNLKVNWSKLDLTIFLTILI